MRLKPVQVHPLSRHSQTTTGLHIILYNNIYVLITNHQSPSRRRHVRL